MYTGHMREGANTDFYQAGARFYSAELGRFFSPDPVTPNYTQPKSLNPYSYVQNNPMTYTDPTGAYLLDATGNFGYMTGKTPDEASFVISASNIVGLDPTADIAACRSSCVGQFLKTSWAADVLMRNGVDINLLRWSWPQRELLANTHTDTVRFGYFAPSAEEIAAYAAVVVPATAILGLKPMGGPAWSMQEAMQFMTTAGEYGSGWGRSADGRMYNMTTSDGVRIGVRTTNLVIGKSIVNLQVTPPGTQGFNYHVTITTSTTGGFYQSPGDRDLAP